MHDRRVDGETLTFGNLGALYMTAMTWWDHKTESSWSQPWGTAIAGPMEGTALTLLPSSIVPWQTWLADHPDTMVLSNDDTGLFYRAELPTDDFVIGVALERWATAYPYGAASMLRVINDRIGDHPVVVFVDPDTRDISVFLRMPFATPPGQAVPDELVFELGDQGRILDTATGSVWGTVAGAATAGPLTGAILQRLPYVTSYDWAWRDFFPHTRFYGY